MISETVHTDLLVNAAPIHDSAGHITAIVAAFQDISNLRNLENTLQENLRETVALYEAQRSLSEAERFEDVLDVIGMQLAIQQPGNSFIVLADEDNHLRIHQSLIAPLEQPERIMSLLHPRDTVHIPDILEKDKVEPEAREALEEMGYRCIITVPLQTRARTLPYYGWLVMLDYEPNAFTPDQERLLTTLGDVEAFGS